MTQDKLAAGRPRGAARAPASAPSVVDAAFVAEARGVESIPPVGPTEVAIAGRSNVGKSTLLNRLAGRRALARTSKTPGRTRGIIFYDLRLAGAPVASLRLADLPGYGWAQVAQTERASWQPLIEGYTARRHTLALFTVLVDARRGVEAEEHQLIEWLDTLGVPMQLVFTKVDKLSIRERARLLAGMRAPARATPARPSPSPPSASGSPRPSSRPPLFVSAQTGEGVVELWQIIFDAMAAHAAAPSMGAAPPSPEPA